MSHRRYTPDSYRIMPWKNGAGSTTELLVEPPGATLAEGFRWRLSMASVAESGPFSRFEGYDRTLLLIEGRGVRVEHGPNGSALLAQPLDGCAFPGEWETSGLLLDGPCLDFNVMSARAVVRHEVFVFRPGPNGASLPVGELTLVFCLRGRIAVPALEEALGPRELLRVDGAADLRVIGLEPETALIVVVFHPALG